MGNQSATEAVRKRVTRENFAAVTQAVVSIDYDLFVFSEAAEYFDLAVSFDGTTTVFEGLNIAIEKGEFVTLVGVSGAGKSTLLRVVADLIRGARQGVPGQDRADRLRSGHRSLLGHISSAHTLVTGRCDGFIFLSPMFLSAIGDSSESVAPSQPPKKRSLQTWIIRCPAAQS